MAQKNDLLGHAAEGLAEIRESGNRVAQLLEQRGIEIVMVKRVERLRVESDRAIELAYAVAHPANHVDE